MKTHECVACGSNINISEDEPCCRFCIKHYPPALLKACSDEFDYACGLRTGEVFVFRNAVIYGEYCTLTGLTNAIPFQFPRGIDVRISDIIWCADAPEGS